MKKIKLIGILPLVACATVPSVTSCACHTTKYTVTLSASDGVTIVGDTTVTVEENTLWKDIKPSVTYDETTVIGYGWYNVSGESPVEIDDNYVISSDCNIKYIAFNAGANLCKVIFKSDTKTYDAIYGVQGATFQEFLDYYEISEPSKEKCIFDGWYDGSTKIDPTTYKLPSTGDLPTLNVDVKYHPDFFNDTWENLCSQATSLANLKTYYKLESFIGLERTIKLNGIVHNVRVIGQEHDVLEDGTTTSLTFELVQLYSDATRTACVCRFDTENNLNYTTSTFRKNLTGQGTGTVYWEKTALQVLQEENAELFNGLKTVKKSVATGSDHQITTYTDKLFPLTFTEMALPESEYAPQSEGSAYDYWSTHTQAPDRKRCAVGRTNGYHYWMNSQYIQDTANTWIVDSSGTVKGRPSSYASGVVFAFCI